jgi:hypothetical protein
MRIPWKSAGIAAAAVVAALVVYLLFIASPYTVVNAGDGKVYKINKRTGESWLLYGNREIPITDHSASQESGESRAMRMAKEAESLKMWFSSLWQQFDSNESYIRRMLQNNGEIEIHGWKSQKVDGDRYLVSCAYDKGQPRGYYFEVNLNTNTVRDIYADTTLAKQYAEFDIRPAYRIEQIKHDENSEDVKAGKWWAGLTEVKIHPVD